MSADPQLSDAEAAARSRVVLHRALLIPAAVAVGAVVLVTCGAILGVSLELDLGVWLAALWPVLVAPCVLALALTGLGAAVGQWLPRTAALLAGCAITVLVLEVVLVIVFVLHVRTSG
jgi:hypothetical protein